MGSGRMQSYSTTASGVRSVNRGQNSVDLTRKTSPYKAYPNRYHQDNIGIDQLRFSDYHQMKNALKNSSEIPRGGHSTGMTMTEIYESLNKKKKLEEEAYSMMLGTYGYLDFEPMRLNRYGLYEKVHNFEKIVKKDKDTLNSLENEILQERSKSISKFKSTIDAEI